MSFQLNNHDKSLCQAQDVYIYILNAWVKKTLPRTFFISTKNILSKRERQREHRASSSSLSLSLIHNILMCLSICSLVEQWRRSHREMASWMLKYSRWIQMNVRMNGICVNRYKQDRWLAYISPCFKTPFGHLQNDNENEKKSQSVRKDGSKIKIILLSNFRRFFSFYYCQLIWSNFCTVCGRQIGIHTVLNLH